MTDTTYAVGELVDVTIRGARVVGTLRRRSDDQYPEIVLALDEHAGQEFSVTLPLVDGVTIERIAPAEWPPLVGDLWRDRAGTLWFDTPNSPYADNHWLIGSNGQGDHANSLLKLNGPLTLVHREPAPADTEGDQS
jgi:hypothetical protein